MEVNNENHPAHPLTIGIRGSGPGAGKDVVGDAICAALAKRGLRHRRERFATPLRECIEVLTGVSVAESETTAGKNRQLDDWGMTVGQMLQRLGTDAVRTHLHPNAWILSLFRRFRDDADSIVVISDVRFPNEVDAVRSRRGAIINVVRPQAADADADKDAARILGGRDPKHAAERGFEEGAAAGAGPHAFVDITIWNGGTLEELRDNAPARSAASAMPRPKKPLFFIILLYRWPRLADMALLGGNRRFFAAMLAIFCMLMVAYCLLLNQGGGRSGSDKIQDGDGLTFSCQGGAGVSVSKATYGPASASTSCDVVDVTAVMQGWAKANPGKTFQVGPSSFPGAKIPACSGNRALTIDYACMPSGDKKPALG